MKSALKIIRRLHACLRDSTRGQRMRGQSSIRTLAALSVAALIIAASYQLGKGSGEERGTVTAAAPTQTPPSQYQLPLPEPDDDGDGAPNWQEDLLGTDPHDSDSTPSEGAMRSQAQGAATSTPEMPLTQQAAEQSIISYIQAKQQQDTLDEDESADIGETVAARLANPAEYEPYTEDDLDVRQDTSSEAVEAYRRASETAMESLTTLGEGEMTVYARYVAHNDKSALDVLERNAGIYRDVAETLTDVPVPQDGIDPHLAAVNALGYYGHVLEQMVTYHDAPLESLVLLRELAEAESYINTTFNGLRSYYSLKQNVAAQ